MCVQEIYHLSKSFSLGWNRRGRLEWKKWWYFFLSIHPIVVL